MFSHLEIDDLQQVFHKYTTSYMSSVTIMTCYRASRNRIAVFHWIPIFTYVDKYFRLLEWYFCVFTNPELLDWYFLKKIFFFENLGWLDWCSMKKVFFKKSRLLDWYPLEKYSLKIQDYCTDVFRKSQDYRTDILWNFFLKILDFWAEVLWKKCSLKNLGLLDWSSLQKSSLKKKTGLLADVIWKSFLLKIYDLIF